METVIRNTEASSLYWKPGSNNVFRERIIGLAQKNKHSVKKREGKDRQSGTERVSINSNLKTGSKY